jgi:ribose 1,5-bisphosphokinase
VTATVFAVVGPSGAGKDMLMAAAARMRPDLMLIRRVITRPASAGGEDFEGVTEAEFAVRNAAGDFALDWAAHGLHYGIPATIHGYLSDGHDVMFNGSRAALSLAEAQFDRLVVVLITAPVSVLAARLAMRGREATADIAARLQRAPFQMPDGLVPRVVSNDATPDEGIARFMAALYPVRG